MALHVPKAPGFAQMLKDGAMVSVHVLRYSATQVTETSTFTITVI